MKFYEGFQSSKDFVEEFYEERGKYPTTREFKLWASNEEASNDISILRGLPYDSIVDVKSSITSNESYILDRWRGEWSVYYIAQIDEFLPKPWSYFAGFKRLLTYGGIGGILSFAARKIKKCLTR